MELFRLEMEVPELLVAVMLLAALLNGAALRVEGGTKFGLATFTETADEPVPKALAGMVTSTSACEILPPAEGTMLCASGASKVQPEIEVREILTVPEPV